MVVGLEGSSCEMAHCRVSSAKVREETADDIKEAPLPDFGKGA